jgi:hypothetical protein
MPQKTGTSRGIATIERGLPACQICIERKSLFLFKIRSVAFFRRGRPADQNEAAREPHTPVSYALAAHVKYYRLSIGISRPASADITDSGDRPMPGRLLLTRNAQFFTAKTDVNLGDALTDLMDAASANMLPEGDFLLDETRVVRAIPNTDLTYRLTAKVFPTTREVYFWDGDDIEDQVYAYIIAVEIESFIALFRKSCADISDALDDYFDPVQSDLLTGTFADSEVDFQKISIRNMTISDRALRARSYEAADLKGLLSSHAAGRSIPYFLKIRQGSRIRTISANNARIVESADRARIDDLAIWVQQQISLLTHPSADKDFLQSFARQVALRDVLSTTRPSAILIESGAIFDAIANDGIAIHRKTKSTGRLAPVTNKGRDQLFQLLEKVYEIDENSKVVGHEDTTKIRVNEKSITFSSKPLKRIWLDDGEKQMSLQKYIIKHGLYSICFADPQFMYFMGRCFKDAAGTAEVGTLLNILEPIATLGTALSEKGTRTTTTTNFQPTSVFGVIEAAHAGDDFIFCDDLGTEWADHITLKKNDPCICFIHSKHGNDVTTSASKLHDVVGQGIKNLGNMYFTVDGFEKKYTDKFTTNYVGTQIARIRKSPADNISLYTKELLADYRLLRKCILACSFMSKQQVAQQFQSIAAGQPVSGHVVQLFWILSSFAHAAKEYNVVPVIYCRP